MKTAQAVRQAAEAESDGKVAELLHSEADHHEAEAAAHQAEADSLQARIDAAKEKARRLRDELGA